MSKTQKQKSTKSLHKVILENQKILGITKVLEVSSKSEDKIGVELSAFNLSYMSSSNKNISVECIFQSSKVFENGGPYTEILRMTSLEAKRYEKLKSSGQLLHFMRKNEIWDLEPRTLFYDWVYLNTLCANYKLAKRVLENDAFTDIEFNPKKSINCQAATVALYVSLARNDLLNKVLQDKKSFTTFMFTQAKRNDSLLF